jgi:transcriptional regulator with XRE-family HTH domain
MRKTELDQRAKLFLDLIKMIPADNAGQEKLADEAKVHKSTLYNWTYGNTISPRIGTLVKVAIALGYEPVWKRIKEKPVLRRVK